MTSDETPDQTADQTTGQTAPPVPSVPSAPAIQLDLDGDLVALFRAVCDVPSVSGDEKALADAIETALRPLAHLDVVRDGNAIVARTHLGRSRRVVIAGHIDTVPLTDPPNLPTRLVGEGAQAEIWGRGTVDMLGGVAIQLALAASLTAPTQDVTWVFYDLEEVAADLNGLGRLARNHPELLQGDFAILGEPTAAGIEGGCNGTLRVEVRVPGITAHSARAWMGSNAIHSASVVLDRLAAYEPASIEVEGLVYREGMNAVGIRGGIAGNVIPDECVVTVNYRFAPSRSLPDAEAHVRDLFSGFEVVVTDAAPGARPGLDDPLAADFAATVLELTGGAPAPKYGWTDVARFAEMGIPAVNFGPGDPVLAHKDDERCPVGHLALCHDALRAWLTR